MSFGIKSVFTAQDAPTLSTLLAHAHVYVNHCGAVYVGGRGYERWLDERELRSLTRRFLALLTPRARHLS